MNFISTACDPNDAHAMWVGLGGYGNPNLLQNGIGSAGNVTGFFAWYEALSSAHSLSQTRITMNIFAGDTVSMSTTYNLTNKSVTFSWHDQSDGQLKSVGPWTTISDPLGTWSQPTSTFYYGGTAEAIDERTAVSGNFDKLVNFGTQSWDQARAYINGSSSYTGMRGGSHLGPTMTNDAQTTILASPTGVSTEAFKDTWQQCGSVEKER